MKRCYPNYDVEAINKWELVRETPYSSSNHVQTSAGEFIVDIQYTPEIVLTITIAHNGILSKNKLEPILKQCGLLAKARGNYKIINYTIADNNGITFGNYGI